MFQVHPDEETLGTVEDMPGKQEVSKVTQKVKRKLVKKVPTEEGVREKLGLD